MSYLKIFPKTIAVQADGAGDFAGRFFYDFESYGQLVCGECSEICIHYKPMPYSSWLISSNQLKTNSNGFHFFLKALNIYFFDILQFDPISHWNNVSGGVYEYFFESVYFDIGVKEFHNVEIFIDTSTESIDKFSMLNNNSNLI